MCHFRAYFKKKKKISGLYLFLNRSRILYFVYLKSALNFIPFKAIGWKQISSYLHFISQNTLENAVIGRKGVFSSQFHGAVAGMLRWQAGTWRSWSQPVQAGEPKACRTHACFIGCDTGESELYHGVKHWTTTALAFTFGLSSTLFVCLFPIKLKLVLLGGTGSMEAWVNGFKCFFVLSE